MRIEFDSEARALYVHVVDEIGEGAVAKTKTIVPDAVLVDLAADGTLLGIEVLDVSRAGSVVDVLVRYGIPVPAEIRFDKIAEALAPTAPAA